MRRTQWIARGYGTGCGTPKVRGRTPAETPYPVLARGRAVGFSVLFASPAGCLSNAELAGVEFGQQGRRQTLR